MKLETILAPTDLEEGSLPGLRAAAELAAATEGRLVVVHVLTSRNIDTTEPRHYAAPVKEQVMAEARERLERQLAEVGAVGAETVVVWGDQSDEITRAAAERDADVIVITVKNRSKVGKLLMGSQAQEIILAADRPVLTVPAAR